MIKLLGRSTCLTLLALTACVVPDHEYRGSVRTSVIAVDSFDAEVEAPGVSLSGETDHSSILFAVGLEERNGSGKKVARAELSLASSEYGDLDAGEFAGGGRIFLPGMDIVSPFFSIYSVVTTFETQLSISNPNGGLSTVDVGTQLALRLGGGAEVQVTENLFFDAGLDYTVPILAAEASVDGFSVPVDTEVSGLALRLGLGVSF